MRYKQALVHPGEMVGVVAGQSIDEPTKKLTLNTFHLAGVSTKSNVTRGVPRIEEILRLTKYPKIPSLTVYFNPVDETDKTRALNYSHMLEHTKLEDVVKNVKLCLDPIEHSIIMSDDQLLLDQFYEFEDVVNECNETDGNDEPKSKWIIRIEIDAEALLERDITMDDIHYAIKETHKDNISCVFSDYNADQLIFRIRTSGSLLKKKESLKSKTSSITIDQSDEIYLLKNLQDNLLQNIILRGVNTALKSDPLSTIGRKNTGFTLITLTDGSTGIATFIAEKEAKRQIQRWKGLAGPKGRFMRFLVTQILK